MPEGTVIERCADAERIMQILAGHTARHGGGILAIDYGYEQGAGDTLQAVRAHQPAGFLENPGENDLTAHVDFGRLKHAAQAAGAAVHGPVTQGRFLLQMGAAARAQALLKNTDPKTACAILGGLERLVSPDQMGTLFLALAVTQQGITPAGL